MADLSPISSRSPTTPQPAAAPLAPLDTFARRHLGSDAGEVRTMLATLGLASLEDLAATAVPAAIRRPQELSIPAALGESTILAELRRIAGRNQVFRSFIGCGYYDCITPPVIQRNVLENPGWYTQYTPYQAEISQGRLEALLNFQTMVCDLTGLEIANASLLDESTAAAEAVNMAHAIKGGPARNTLFVAADCHPQTLAVVSTRAQPLGLTIEVGPLETFQPAERHFAVLLQYPGTGGDIVDLSPLVAAAHAAGAMAIVACDLLALTLLRPPGECGADIAIGSAQRFGVPLGYGGPHAAFFATRDAFKRHMPGRLIGVSKDAQGNPALRLSLQTREQHIRRDKATSNICTAQVLLAVIASFYAVYHGPQGLTAIARRVLRLTHTLASGLTKLGFTLNREPVFDTLTVQLGRSSAAHLISHAHEHRINLRPRSADSVSIALDETTTAEDLAALLHLFAAAASRPPAPLEPVDEARLPESLARTSAFLTHPTFNRYHTETEMLRYIRRLEARDLSLCHSMIPLGSCTMKLNATAEMFPISWPEFARLHPFAPIEQAAGYQEIFRDLERWLAEITGFAAVSLQPNAGSAGEYAGLLVIRAWHAHRGDAGRTVCLIPTSAHGTNPASAVMAGFTVVPVACDTQGNIDLADLRAKAERHAAQLGALMVTYPSTHGVFETQIREVCALIHAHGGQVYMDGANLNAQVGLTAPGYIGADVCHLNLHKTFAIPHGGGGPGMGPIAVAAHLAPFLPSHPVVPPRGAETPATAVGPIAAAPWGSANVLLISWAYIRMMGGAGLTEATLLAILNANYIAHRLAAHFPVVYRGPGGCVAHECIVDLRAWKQRAGIEVEDVAKRLMDYGYHAPTMSWPVAGTLMIEPTESESRAELDRFCDALLSIHAEMAAVERGEADRVNNVLKNAPHTAAVVCRDRWDRPYSRELAAFPSAEARAAKFWPAVGRVDNTYGDRNLVCTCAGMEAFAETKA